MPAPHEDAAEAIAGKVVLETVAAAIDAGQEITPEHASTRVVLYRASIIIVHPVYTLVLCADCGQVKATHVTDYGELSSVERDRLARSLQSLSKCRCCGKSSCVLTEALQAARSTLALVQNTAPGYDWNADPLALTLVTGEAFAQIDAALTQASSERRGK